MSLLDKMSKSGAIKMSSVLSESDFFNEKDMIKTKLPVINMAFSGEVDGGFTTGLTILAGESKTFKSCLSLYCLKAYQDAYPDSVCLFYDNEYGITPQYLKTFGIDSSRIIHIPIEHVEQLKFDMVKRLNEINRGDKVFILVDSLGNLASKKEVEDAEAEKSVADMSRAKAIRSFFRITTPLFTKKNIPAFLINHVYMEQGMFPKTVIPGGCVAAGTKVVMADNTIRQIEDIEVGEFVKTMTGAKEVIGAWDPETLDEGTPECIEIEFEDGYKVVTSDTHKFLVSEGDQFKWVEAKDLTEDMDIVES